MNEYINITADNIADEHLCCAIADKKHADGVNCKKAWLKERIGEGHVFRKLNVKGKVFIEYAPLETAWTPVDGDSYIYIYCLWVCGSYAGKGYANELLTYAIDEAKKQNKSGLCVLSARKKKPFLSDKKFFEHYGFNVVDSVGEYELLALSFDGKMPKLCDNAKKMTIADKNLTIYYGMQCPYIANCINEITSYCEQNKIPLTLVKVDSVKVAKELPCVFNNWAVFYNGQFVTTHLLNEGFLKKLLNI